MNRTNNTRNGHSDTAHTGLCAPMRRGDHQIRQHVTKPREEGRLMRRQMGLLSVVGFFGLLASANAQTLSASTAGPSFDGTYQAVSSAKINQMYIAQKGNMGVCPDRVPGPLTIVQGQARYTDASGDEVDGTVGHRASWRCKRRSPAVPGQWTWTSAVA